MTYLPRAAALLLLLVVLVLPVAPARAETDPDAVRAKVLTLLAESDNYAAIEYVQSLGAPPAIAQAYDQLVRDLGWKEKDAAAAVVMGRAGVLYCLTKAQEVAARAPDQAPAWKSQAKTIAYNVASIAWPGWGGDAERPGADVVAAGAEAAALNLRLARELEKPAKALSAAHWIVGAHRLATGDFDGATLSFDLAGKFATEADDEEGALMNAGYAALAHTLAGREGGKAEMQAAVKALRARETGDATFYADQIDTALGALRAWLDRAK